MAVKLLTIDEFYRTGGDWTGTFCGRPIQKVTLDSRDCGPDSVFFALPGTQTDGHQYISKAIKAGASVIVYSDAAFDREFIGTETLGIRTDDVVSYMQDLAARVVRKVKIPVLALTGSNGKTTTKEMISAVLETGFRVHKTNRNLNNHLGVPLTIFDLTADHEFLVLEMGMNHAGEIARLCEVGMPTSGLITNVGTAHIEFLGSQENIAKAKTELFDYLRRNNGFLYVNADDPFLLKRLTGNNNAMSVFYGIKNREAKVKAYDVQLGQNNAYQFNWKDVRTGKTGSVQLSIPGMHNVLNALAAIAAGLKNDISPEAIDRALSGFKPADKRMELAKAGKIDLLIDCYNANPDSMKAGLSAFNEFRSEGRKIAVLGDMFELGSHSEAMHRSVGKAILPLKFDGILTVGQSSRHLSDELKKYVCELGVHHFETRENVMGWLDSTLKPGDMVYLKASRGMKLETISDFLTETFGGKE